NVKGAFFMARAAAPALRATGRGNIVNISSMAGLGWKGSSIPYGLSKAALNNLTVSLARVLGPAIRVNGIAPGFVETTKLAETYGERLRPIRIIVERSTPLRRTATSEDVAQAVVSLVTGMDWLNGQTLVLDGGFSTST